MSWVRYDDGFHDHLKVMEARDRDPGSLALHLLANTWSARSKRPGFVPAVVPRQLVGAKAKRWADILVESGLWHAVEGGWEFHDWADYAAPGKYRTVPGTPEEISAKRAAAGRRGGKATQARKQKVKQTGEQNEASASPSNEQVSSKQASPVVSSSSVLRTSEPLTPEPVPTTSGVASLRQPNAGDVVAAWIEGAETASGERPGNRLIAQVGRQARELIDEGKDPVRLVAAARAAGTKGFADLPRELLRAATPVPINGNRPSTTDQRVAAGLALVHKFAAQEAP